MQIAYEIKDEKEADVLQYKSNYRNFSFMRIGVRRTLLKTAETA